MLFEFECARFDPVLFRRIVGEFLVVFFSAEYDTTKAHFNHRQVMRSDGDCAYAREKLFTPDKGTIAITPHHLPMVEVRLGGIILSRKEHHQEFPHYPPKVHKIKQRTLKFKK